MKILNIGSLNIDRTYRVHEFVQPGETIKALSYAEYCGGKGLNQSIALARAGACVWHAGAVGADGDALRRALVDAGVRDEFIQRVEGPTGHAVIQVTDTGQNDIIICGGANDKVSRELIDRALAALEPGDMVLLQNETANVAHAMRAAKERGLTVAFNPSPMNAGVLDLDLGLVDLFILNEGEACALAGLEHAAAPEEVLEALRERYGIARIVMTLGHAGCRFAAPDGTFASCGAYRVEAVDTTGAGDTFCGFFLAGIASGSSPREALVRASAAAAISVTGAGAAQSIPAASEVDAFMRTHTMP